MKKNIHINPHSAGPGMDQNKFLDVSGSKTWYAKFS